MQKLDFINKVKADSNLQIEEKDGFFIGFNIKLNKKYKIPFTTVERTDWKNIHDVLYGRDPYIMDGITRICGYFSKTSNWNKSKQGELADRRKGNYNIGGSC